jgi:glycosyltransferase involved in cell wall biosynthesis
VVAEALIHGVPVLTTDSTPWQELDAHGAGHCVPWNNFGAALGALLAESPAALRASGERARAWAQTSFSWENAAETLLAFYAQLIATK